MDDIGLTTLALTFRFEEEDMIELVMYCASAFANQCPARLRMLPQSSKELFTIAKILRDKQTARGNVDIPSYMAILDKYSRQVGAIIVIIAMEIDPRIYSVASMCPKRDDKGIVMVSHLMKIKNWFENKGARS
jgi:hypothetical protein